MQAQFSFLSGHCCTGIFGFATWRSPPVCLPVGKEKPTRPCNFRVALRTESRPPLQFRPLLLNSEHWEEVWKGNVKFWCLDLPRWHTISQYASSLPPFLFLFVFSVLLCYVLSLFSVYMHHIFNCHLVAQEQNPCVLPEAEKKVGTASTPPFQPPPVTTRLTPQLLYEGLYPLCEKRNESTLSQSGWGRVWWPMIKLC